MASGNATITYSGSEPEIALGGETFVKDQPAHCVDQGVIGAAKDHDEFTVIDHREEAAEPKPAKKAAKK